MVPMVPHSPNRLSTINFPFRIWVTYRRWRVDLDQLSSPDPCKSFRMVKDSYTFQNCRSLARCSHMLSLLCTTWFHGRSLDSSKISSHVVHNQSSLACWSSDRIISRITSSWSNPYVCVEGSPPSSLLPVEDIPFLLTHSGTWRDLIVLNCVFLLLPPLRIVRKIRPSRCF